MKFDQLSYILFFKPYRVLSQFTDEGTGHPTLKQYIDMPNVYAAGHLDRNSEGLLLLTNDGMLIKRLTFGAFYLRRLLIKTVEKTVFLFGQKSTAGG